LPVDAVRAAFKEAAVRGYDVLIVDSAGRLHVDEELMEELRRLVKAAPPHETLFVGDSMTGQDAVRSAAAFDAAVPLTGIILTKLDGDARGGAALSMAQVTGKPIRYVGLGEKADDLELFHPDRVVGRILGMGDVLTLIEKAAKVIDQGVAQETLKKARRGELTLEDFRDQLRQVRKLGSMDKILEMMPGGAQMKGKLQVDDRWTVHAEAIINSMTKRERTNPRFVDSSRKRRIARGSGRPLSEVNRLLKSFKQAKQMHVKMMAAGRGGKVPRMPFVP
jgi:signal recognition particle subunit SRP54